MIKIDKKPTEEAENNLDPYVALRAGIIRKALEDLLELEKQYKKTGSKRTAQSIYALMREMHSPWFEWLCDPYQVDFLISEAREKGLKAKFQHANQQDGIGRAHV